MLRETKASHNFVDSKFLVNVDNGLKEKFQIDYKIDCFSIVFGDVGDLILIHLDSFKAFNRNL